MSPRLRSIGLFALTLLAAIAVAGPAGARKGDRPVPGVTTVEAVGSRSATVKALLDAKGSSTAYHFEYGVAPAYDMATAEAKLLSGKATVSGALTGLAPGARYDVRLVAVNDDGAATGASAEFQTAAATSTPSEEPEQDPEEPADEPPPRAGAPEPVLGETVVAAPTKGEVKVRPPGAAAFTALEAGARIPVGSRVDARSGAVAVTSEIDSYGAIQTGEFGGGVFVVRQSPDGDGVTDIHLRGGSFRGCRRAHAAGARTLAQASAKRRRRVRRLWGSDDHGRFRTHGRDSVATVRGTRWVTVDRCGGTLTRVTSGAVDVRARHGGRSVTVRAGDSHFARHRR